MKSPLPSQLIVWRPDQLVGDWRDSEEWVASNCLSTTKAGDRAVIYQSGRDGGLVLLYDFVTDAQRHRDLAYAAWGAATPIDPPVPRAALLKDPVLGPIFRTRPSKRILAPEASEAVARLVGDLPQRATVDAPIPDPAQDWRWSPAGPWTWGNEKGMQEAICTGGWSRLGFGKPPEREVNPPDSNDRIDIYGPGLIAECKLFADTSALRQLDDQYLEPLNEKAADTAPNRRWFGMIITAKGYTRELVKQVVERDDVQLLVCLRSENESADGTEQMSFVEITDPDQPSPFDPIPIGEELRYLVEEVSGQLSLLRELGVQAGLPAAVVSDLLADESDLPELEESAFEKLASAEKAEIWLRIGAASVRNAAVTGIELGAVAGANPTEIRNACADFFPGLELDPAETTAAGSAAAEELLREHIADLMDVIDSGGELAELAGAPPSVLDAVNADVGDADRPTNLYIDLCDSADAALDRGLALGMRSGMSDEDLEAVLTDVAPDTD